MRKRALSLRALLPTFTIMLAVLLVYAGKAYSRYYISAYFKGAGSSICKLQTLPAGCGPAASGTVCTLNGDTWYTTSSCTSVYYRLP